MKKLTVCLISLLLAQFSFGQDRRSRPDLSGTWRLVESRNIRRNQPGTFTKTLVITHRDPEIRVTTQLNENGRERSLEQVYFSDNRGESNPTFAENQTIRSQTRWRGDKLETRRSESTTLRSPNGETITVRIEIRERWELSEDRSRLMHTTSVSSSSGGRTVNILSGDASPAVEVFSRVEQ
jgi:hypothetical protein